MNDSSRPIEDTQTYSAPTHSTLELAPDERLENGKEVPTYSTLELAPDERLDNLKEVLPYSTLELAPDERVENGKEVTPEEYHHDFDGGSVEKKRRIFWLPMPWLIAAVALLLLAVIGAIVGGVLGSRASANNDAPASAVSTVYVPITTAGPSPTLSSTANSMSSALSASTSSTSSSSPFLSRSPGVFLSNRWHFIQTVDFDGGLSILLVAGNTTGDSIKLVSDGNLGAGSHQFWQLRSAPNTFSTTPSYFLHNRAFGSGLRLALGEEDRQFSVYNLLFAPANVERRNQYWYFETRANANYSVVYNLESGVNFPLTMAVDWKNPMMAGGDHDDGRKGEEVWRGPPAGTRRFAIVDSGERIEGMED